MKRSRNTVQSSASSLKKMSVDSEASVKFKTGDKPPSVIEPWKTIGCRIHKGMFICTIDTFSVIYTQMHVVCFFVRRQIQDHIISVHRYTISCVRGAYSDHFQVIIFMNICI